MARMEGRLAKLEQAEVEDLASVYTRLGGSAEDAVIWARAYRRAKAEAPPTPVEGGMVDMEPTLRRLAELMGLDPEEVMEEVNKIVTADTG